LHAVEIFFAQRWLGSDGNKTKMLRPRL